MLFDCHSRSNKLSTAATASSLDNSEAPIRVQPRLAAPVAESARCLLVPFGTVTGTSVVTDEAAEFAATDFVEATGLEPSTIGISTGKTCAISCSAFERG